MGCEPKIRPLVVDYYYCEKSQARKVTTMRFGSACLLLKLTAVSDT